MNTPSAEPAEIARKNETILLRRIAEVGLEAIAHEFGVDPSTVSRWKGKEVQLFARLAAFFGYKLVPAGAHCYSERQISWLIQGTKEYAASLKSADDLEWEKDV